MNTQNIRLFFISILALLGFFLYQAYEQENKSQAAIHSKQAGLNKTLPDMDIPAALTETTSTAKTDQVKSSQKINDSAENATTAKREFITVKTDVLNVKIDPLGGDLVDLSLPAYADDRIPPRKDYQLFNDTPQSFYIAQSGLTGEDGPDIRGVSRAQYQTSKKEYNLEPGVDRIAVDLQTKTPQGVAVTKRFIFYRNQYAIDLEYLIDNNSNQPYKGSFYARLKRKAEKEGGSQFLGVQTYSGAALYTPETPYKKISFKDIQEKPFSKVVQGGWAAMVEHYFVTAWIPEAGIPYTYQTEKQNNDIYSIGFISEPIVVNPQEQTSINAKLYAGPEVTDTLQKLAPGLDLTVDYGILWPICKPIFWLLKQIYEVVGNWGWAIVIITILIKLLFYRLSETSYRSMGKMRKLQPKMTALKERYGEDKQKFSQAVMELYKKEKINPLGGCLPILVQIPVFIALYYVLLGSVELRQAPFILWIQDLSAKDPYYVLPVLMGLSMFVQQKLNPTPPDPVQAKVMMLMPIVFTILFLNFPSGLVLYWLVNNVLSILQQWFITRRIEMAGAHAT